MKNNNNLTTTSPFCPFFSFFYLNTKIMCIVIDKHKTYLLPCFEIFVSNNGATETEHFCE